MKIRGIDVMNWMINKRGVSGRRLTVVLVVLFAMILNSEVDRTEIEKEIREFKEAA